MLMLIFISAFFICFFYDFSDNKYIKKISSTVEYSSTYKKINKDNVDSNSLSDIDTLSVLYNYLLTLESSSSINASYKVVGYLKVLDGDKEIFNEELTHESDNEESVEGSILNIKTTSEVNFKDHYREYLNVLLNDAYKDKQIKIDYILENNINLYSDYLNKNIKKKDDVILSVDLTNNKINETHETKDEILYGVVDIDTCYAICLELFSSIVLFTLIIILVLKRIIRIKSSLEYKRENILKRYKDKIIKVRNLPLIDDKSVVLVSNFKDLLSIQKETNKPINYLDIKNRYEATFVIMVGNVSYVYKLK